MTADQVQRIIIIGLICFFGVSLLLNAITIVDLLKDIKAGQ